jgi:hypothetical protein
MQIDYATIFRKSVSKIQVSLNSDSTTGTLYKDQYNLWSYLSRFFLE